MVWFAAAFSQGPEKFRAVYSPVVLGMIADSCLYFPELITPDNFHQFHDELRSVEVIFSTWGMFSLTEEQLDAMPALKIVFYAVGATEYFSAPHSTWDKDCQCMAG